VLPIDYIHAVCLAGIALYIWGREPPRLLLTPLMLISFFVLYGVGNIIYFAGADTVPEAHRAVALSLILMWFGLVIGIEGARLALPSANARSIEVLRSWRSTPVSDRPQGNQLLAGLGILTALYILGVFYFLGKPGQLSSFAFLQSAADKVKFRADFGYEGGYLYQLLITSVAAFLAFLLVLKGAASGQRYLTLIGLVVGVAVFAGKIGTFEKIPWVIYLLQIIVVFQARRGLDFGAGRMLLALTVVVVGAVGAAMIAIPQLDSAGIAEWLSYRFFEINNEVVYQTFYVYPHYLPHTWGMNIGLLFSLFGSGDLVSAHTQVANFFGAFGATFDSFFIGDAWVDFSYGGVLALSLAVGFVVKSVDIFVTSLGKTPLCIALIGSGLYGLFQLQVTSAFTAFFSGGLVLIPFLASVSAGFAGDFLRPGAPSRMQREESR
jgi:hypothetical protein